MTSPLIVDLYEPEGAKDWKRFAAAGQPWVGLVQKLTQGVTYQSGTWYENTRRSYLDAMGDRMGATAFRGDYVYLSFASNAVKQADYAFARLTRGGGFHRGMLPTWVDVEAASQPAGLTRQRVMDAVNQFAERWAYLTGKAPVLYGGSLMRDLKIPDRMGCSHSWVAGYNAELRSYDANGRPYGSTADFLARTGTDLQHLMGWQYCGDGEGKLASYPIEAPGVGKCDISTLTLPGGLPALRTLCYDTPTNLPPARIVSG